MCTPTKSQKAINVLLPNPKTPQIYRIYYLNAMEILLILKIMNTTYNTTTTDPGGESGAGYEWWRFLSNSSSSFLSAIFSGLNLGIIGLDPGYLELLTMGPFETK
jgi:hypothetical protein